MKINVEQLPSGAYRIRKTVRGKTYRVTVDYKPTESEALRLLADVMGKGGTARTPLTFGEAAERHLSALDGVLSVSTLSTYRRFLDMLRRDYKRFCAVRMKDLTSADVQKVITRYASTHAPRSTSTLYIYIRSVVRHTDPEINIRVKLPAQMPVERYIPTEADVRAIYDVLKGTSYEIPFRLALCGMRRSEICALTVDDLDADNCFFVHRAKVKDASRRWVTVDRTKTPESTRRVRIPDDLAELIRQAGHVYDGCPTNITKHLYLVQDRLGLPHFSIHKLRHFYVSYAHTLVPDAYIMQNCGYKTDGVMKSIYRHALTDRRTEMDRKVLDGIGSVLS